MDENDVIAAVCPYLERQGYRIIHQCTTTQHGVDIIAERTDSGKKMYVEAKGGTSSRAGSARYGKPYTRNQIFDRVSKGVFTGLQMRQEHPKPDEIVLAFPELKSVHDYLDSVHALLKQLEIIVVLVRDDNQVMRYI